MTPLIELRGIGKRFAGGTDVLAGVDLEIDGGQSLAIVGPSGSGKSTLLNIIGGLLPPSSGSVLFEGTDLASLSRNELAAFRNRKVGYVFQSHHLLPQCTALENVLIPTLANTSATSRRDVTDRAKTLLHELGLDERLNSHFEWSKIGVPPARVRSCGAQPRTRRIARPRRTCRPS